MWLPHSTYSLNNHFMGMDQMLYTAPHVWYTMGNGTGELPILMALRETDYNQVSSKQMHKWLTIGGNKWEETKW